MVTNWALAVRQRLLELSLDVAIGYAELGNLAVVQQLLKLAVRDRRHLLRGRIEILEQEQADERSHPVADMKAGSLVHGRLSSEHGG